MFPLVQLAYEKGLRAPALALEEDMGELPCIDTAYQDEVLASRTQDVTSKLGAVVVSVDAVGVDAPQGHAWPGHPWWDGHVAMRLIEDKKSVRKDLDRWPLRIPKTAVVCGGLWE